MARTSEIDIGKSFERIHKRARRQMNDRIRRAVRRTYDFIEEISPVYTGAYKSNHQILLTGDSYRDPNVADSIEKDEAKKMDNKGAGPSGTPVGRFPGLIADNSAENHARIWEIDVDEVRQVTLGNNTPYESFVEWKYGYMIYNQAYDKLRAEIRKGYKK